MTGSRRRSRLPIGLSVGLSLAGCERSQSAVTTTESPVTPVRPSASRASQKSVVSLDQRFVSGAVYGNRIARRVLYTWTTDDQIDQLRTHKVLLTRKRSPQKGMARFDRTIQGQEGAVETLLQKAGWDRRRFAWPNAWATVGGWQRETYGDRLVRIQLREDAIIGIYEAYTDKPWRFVSMSDEPVAVETVLARPEMLAAVYHLSDIDSYGMDTFASASLFREYVIVNELMIESWSIGTQAIVDEIRDGAALLQAFRQVLGRSPNTAIGTWYQWKRHVANNVWPAPVKKPSTHWLYEANLSLPNQVYRPDVDTLTRLSATLTAAAEVQGESLIHRPDADRLRAFWREHADEHVPVVTPGPSAEPGTF